MTSKSSSSSSLSSSVSLGLLTLHRPHVSSLPSIPLPPHYRSLSHCDLINKSSRSKQRFLFQLPGRFNLLPPSKQQAVPTSSSSPASCLPSSSLGCIGELADLDTSNPILYLDFPDGRIKMRGFLVYPANPLLAVQLPRSLRSSTRSLDCRGSFDHLIIFNQYWWIGNKQNNSNEDPLDWPEHYSAASSIPLNQASSSLSDDWFVSSHELSQQDEDEQTSEQNEEVEKSDEEVKRKKKRKDKQQSKRANKKKRKNSSEEEEESVEEITNKRPRRESRKLIKYTEKDEEEEKEEEQEEEEEEEEEDDDDDEEQDDDEAAESDDDSVVSDSDGSNFDPDDE
jgi:hypothetical protein